MRAEDAERYVLARELFGMRFGLDRMRRMMTALEHPEQRFESIHVVGTNGKSSTVRMIAAILERHGVRTGAFLSPHLVSYGERIRIQETDLEPRAFAAAVARVIRAAELVDRSLGAGEQVTQFELLTAAAYSEMAAQGVEVAVVEAGLGGRYDATNVIPSRVQVLTGVGLEHTRWLGPTIRDIASEKLDVVKPQGTLVLGHGLHTDAVEVAETVAAERGARIVRAPADPGVPVGAPGLFQRRNFALARAAAGAYLGRLDEPAVARAATEVRVPGRLQVIAQDPVTIVDSAHNPDGIAALVQSLPEVAGPGAKRLVAVLSILDDKDAAGMLAGLLAVCQAVVFTSSQNPRALPPPTLQSLARQLDGPPAEIVPDPQAALDRARQLAGPSGAVVAAGSIYLVADLLRPELVRRVSTL
ncbi:MAG TPA: cyanophycin synthetase [Solirubrobacteraceae bacterium]|nr:cyanophycin synthetase [Solirubrobacteraceae bacterium]